MIATWLLPGCNSIPNLQEVCSEMNSQAKSLTSQFNHTVPPNNRACTILFFQLWSNLQLYIGLQVANTYLLPCLPIS